jgi:membrane protein
MTAWRALWRFFRGDGMVFAGYLAFLSLLALLPVLGVLFWLSQQSSLIHTADAAFRDFLFSNLIPDAAKQIVGVVDKLRSNARGLGLLGVAIIAVDLVLKALALTTAVDRLWSGGTRRWWGFFNGAFVLLVIVPPVVGALYWVIRFFEKFMMNLFPVARRFFDSAFDPFAIAVPLIAALTLLYRWVPSNVKSWRSPLAAALLVALLIELARYVITHHFATLGQLKSLYGAFVAIPVLMVSAFVIWALVLYGAALVAEGFGENLRYGRTRSSSRGKSQSEAATKSSTIVANSKTR